MTHVAWCFLAILRLAPTAPSSPAPEDADARLTRLLDVATDVAEVAPTRADAALLLAVAALESGFSRDVDGPACAPWVVRRRGCDDGKAKGLWQMHDRAGARVPAERRAQAREALRRLRGSLGACRDLTMYASGQCGAGRVAADRRLTLARRVEAWLP